MKNALLASLPLAAATIACQPPSEPATTAAGPAGSTAASPATLPKAELPDSAQLIKAFVPAGYRVQYTVAGDLNRDAWPDRVVVLDTAAQLTDATPEAVADRITWFNRPLLLLLGEPGGARYRLAARNDSVVDRRGAGPTGSEDTFRRVALKKGYFSVEGAGGSSLRWYKVTTFRYDPADKHWYLHRIGQDNTHLDGDDAVEHEVTTPRDFGRVRFEDYAGAQ
ncbi:hypothetical protein [Hymenobacter cheonanensis]|uniref:hypothetical protein n=1 Tax=Hymenobacter sp. CA2-7 TaxID=3063993 RepID=UPI002713C2C9|nr:hypothetical protein [Hymenobacter sp. CA2-7]MDO7885590.1 hypothetical protein [Hymenobacter sp. CA2-7]